MRAFLAIAPPAPLAARLAALADDLDEGNMVPEESIHLTVAFLGEHPAAVIEEMAENFAARPLAPARVEVSGLGVFGGRRRRAAYAAVLADDGLSRLNAAARLAARAAGEELPRRRFTPHITLSRFSARAPAGPGLERWLARHARFRAAAFAPRRIVLIESVLTRDGPRYAELAKIPMPTPV